MNRFENSKVILTGGASGIGRATVHAFVDEGAEIFVIDRNADGLAETAQTASRPEAVHTHVADLSVEDEVVAAAAAGVAALGGVDALVNVAGFLRLTPMSEVTSQDYRDLWNVNFLAPVLMCRELIPALPDETGVIVNVCSTSATKSHPSMTAYASSKGALLSFSYSLSAELAGRGIRVVPVSPGGVATPLTAAVAQSGFDASFYARTQPLRGAPAQPAELAAAITFAASPQASYVNGVELRIDGGSHV